MENALTTLSRATVMALGLAASTPQGRHQLYKRIANCFALQGRENDLDNMDAFPNFAALMRAAPVWMVNEDGSVSSRPHPFWMRADTFAPAIASLAVFFERIVCPYDDTRFRIDLRPKRDALFGYELISLSAEPYDYRDGKRCGAPHDDEHKLQTSIYLTSAACSFFLVPELMKLGPMYMRRMVEGDFDPKKCPAPLDPSGLVFNSV